MKISTKTTLIIIGILFIGVIIGVLGGGIFHQKRFENFDRIRRMTPDKRFLKVIDDIIRPDAKQRDQIKDIMDEQSEKIARIDDEYQSKILAIFDSARQEINSLLSEDQIIRLEEQLARDHKRFFRGRLKRLSGYLELSEQQQKKIEEIFREFAPRFDPNKELLTGGKTKRIPEFNNHSDEITRRIKSVLTPEQMKKYSRFKKRQGGERKNRRSKGFPPTFKEKPPKRDGE